MADVSFMGPKLILWAVGLVYGEYRPKAIIDLNEEIERETLALKVSFSTTGTINQKRFSALVRMKLQLDDLYLDWAKGRISWMLDRCLLTRREDMGSCVVKVLELSLRTYRQGDHFVGVITDRTNGEVLATKKTRGGKGEGNTLTHLSRKLRSTRLVPASLKIMKNSTTLYTMERHA